MCQVAALFVRLPQRLVCNRSSLQVDMLTSESVCIGNASLHLANIICRLMACFLLDPGR